AGEEPEAREPGTRPRRAADGSLARDEARRDEAAEREDGDRDARARGAPRERPLACRLDEGGVARGERGDGGRDRVDPAHDEHRRRDEREEHGRDAEPEGHVPRRPQVVHVRGALRTARRVYLPQSMRRTTSPSWRMSPSFKLARRTLRPFTWSPFA